MNKEKELSKSIVKGNVADYAKSTASVNRISNEELKQILLEIAELL